jgi:hypothetical protein
MVSGEWWELYLRLLRRALRVPWPISEPLPLRDLTWLDSVLVSCEVVSSLAGSTHRLGCDCSDRAYNSSCTHDTRRIIYDAWRYKSKEES